MTPRNWFLEQWKGVIFPKKSLFSLFPTTGRVHVLRQPKRAFHPDCLKSTVKNGEGSVMNDLGRYFLENRRANDFLHGRINKRDYLKIVIDQFHHMAQALFPEGNAIFQDDNSPIHTSRIVKD